MNTLRDLKQPLPGTEKSGTEVFPPEKLKAILEMLEEHRVSEFALEQCGAKLSLKRGEQQNSAHSSAPAPASQPNPTIPNSTMSFPTAQQAMSGYSAAPSSPAPVAIAPALGPAKETYVEVRSPMVGTFYRRPAVDSAPYVDVGDTVKKGDVLCIVEAMKLMNEIESEISGKIAQVCLQDGQMVEYGEVLFRIEPSL